MFKSFIKIIYKNLELIFWIFGLIYLALISPEQTHLSFCPLNNIGMNWCPGCGLGKSISLIFQFRISDAIQFHPLGIFAISIIAYRIIQLIKNIRREQYG